MNQGQNKMNHGFYAAFFCVLMATSAHADTRNVVRDDRGGVAVNNFNNCVRSTYSDDNDVCSPPKPKPVAQPVRVVERKVIAQEERTVYFGFNKASLTSEAKQKLDSLADKLKADTQVRQARIVGYADRIGNEAYNQQLSKQRAEAVSNYLVARGFVNSQVADVRWLGESVPATECSDKLSRAKLIECLQTDRRVEAEIDYIE